MEPLDGAPLDVPEEARGWVGISRSGPEPADGVVGPIEVTGERLGGAPEGLPDAGADGDKGLAFGEIDVPIELEGRVGVAADLIQLRAGAHEVRAGQGALPPREGVHGAGVGRGRIGRVRVGCRGVRGEGVLAR